MPEPQPLKQNPKLWLGLSIAAVPLCCSPLAIVGIVYSALAIDALSKGGPHSSVFLDRLKSAKTWTIWAIALGAVVIGCAGLSALPNSGA